MTSIQKTALSLLISTLIFGACLCFALLGGFNYLEIHFYEPRVVENTNVRLDEISAVFEDYEKNIKYDLSSYVSEKSVQTYIERTVSEEEAKSRAEATEKLFDKLPGLEGIRIVESNGDNVHFSTFLQDVKSENGELISYMNYSDLKEISFPLISVPDTGDYCNTVEKYYDRCGVYYDSSIECIIYSFPYFDHYTAYRGTALFYISADDLMRDLIAKNLVSLNTRCCLVAPMNANANYQNGKNSGLVFNIPYSSRAAIKNDVEGKWSKGLYGVEQLLKSNEGDKVLVLVSKKGVDNLSFGWVLFESDFTFSRAERALILLCVFITVFLVVFLLFNLKHDDMVVIRGRVHKFHMALLSEYLARHDTKDWGEITRDLNYRKVDANEEIKRSLGRRGKKYSKELDELLDESWNDLFNAVGGTSNVRKIKSSEDTKTVEIKENSVVESVTPVVSEVDDLEEVEELEDIPEAESVEEVEELEDIPEAESVEEVEELEDIPEAESVEEVEELEDIPEAESVEEVKELDEVSSVDTSESVEEKSANEMQNDSSMNVSESGNEQKKVGFLAMAQSLKEDDSVIKEIPGEEERKEILKDEAFAEDFEIGDPDFSKLDDEEKNNSEEL